MRTVQDRTPPKVVLLLFPTRATSVSTVSHVLPPNLAPEPVPPDPGIHRQSETATRLIVHGSGIVVFH